MLALWIALCAFCLCEVGANSTIAECPRSPGRVNARDVSYQLGIAGEPNLFLPGELYTVTLQGVDSGKGTTPFIGFTIWAELVNEAVETDAKDNNASTTDAQPLGSFQAYDAQTKVQETCAPSVENATAHPKTEVQVIWNAPAKPVDSCVWLCARAGPSDLAGGAWSVLAHKLCPAPATPARLTAQPPIVEPCCACDEAKYEVTFEGLWSRNTHPREFPSEALRAHFGDVIGASHTAQYRVWQEGRVASSGLRSLAGDGSTTALEKELKAESEHIRTIIKARGISWQQVASANAPATFAVFRVDARHHLVSLAAKLAPSPDWLVGVSALELCERNCTWRDAISLPLYPYDAGFDSGISYVNRRRLPTIPAAAVRALRPDWPADVRSPFYNTAGEMRPFARLKLTRLRLYEKNCDAVNAAATSDSAPLAGGACTTHTWGAWGACSVSCGRGRATRQRRYVWPQRARAEACRVKLTDYKECYGPRRHCRAPTEYEPDPASSTGPCAVSEWSEWSPCEGCGVRARTRHYLAPKAHKRCHVGYRARTVMSQAMPCDAGPCYKPPPQFANATNFDWFYVDKVAGQCSVTAWGEWSPCSARCGRGRRMRTRLYLAPRDARAGLQAAVTARLMDDWNRRFAEIQRLELPAENKTLSDPELEAEVQEFMDRCQFTLTQQEALCDGDRCADSAVKPETCVLPSDVGHCRGYEERWFYDARARSCEPFGYSGCGGNDNNFRGRADCVRACGNVTVDGGISTKGPVVISTASPADNEVMQADASAKATVHCKVSRWIGWSECAGACDYAFKLNFRRVLHNEQEGGKPCPHLVRIRKCIPKYCKASSASPSGRAGRYSRN